MHDASIHLLLRLKKVKALVLIRRNACKFPFLRNAIYGHHCQNLGVTGDSSSLRQQMANRTHTYTLDTVGIQRRRRKALISPQDNAITDSICYTLPSNLEGSHPLAIQSRKSQPGLSWHFTLYDQKNWAYACSQVSKNASAIRR
jgi:hypothetical protein